MKFTFQKNELVFGTSIASGTALTASDVASTAIDVTHDSQVYVEVYYTPKTGQSNRNMYVYPEFSYDAGTTYVPLTKGVDSTPSGGEIATTVYANRFTLPGVRS